DRPARAAGLDARLRAVGRGLGRLLPVHAPGRGRVRSGRDRRRARGRRFGLPAAAAAVARPGPATAGALEEAAGDRCPELGLSLPALRVRADHHHDRPLGHPERHRAAVRRRRGLALAARPARRLARHRPRHRFRRRRPARVGRGQLQARRQRDGLGLGGHRLPGGHALLWHRRDRRKTAPGRCAAPGHGDRQPAGRNSRAGAACLVELAGESTGRHCLAGPRCRRRGVHGTGVLPVLPAHRGGRAGARTRRHLRGAGVRGVLRRALPGRGCHRVDAAVRGRHRLWHGVVDPAAAPAALADAATGPL
ncbi:MAG: Permease of the drug/metabolite transporter (DMT) superfamily, partial [uncultured Ramlibacter sp.]